MLSVTTATTEKLKPAKVHEDFMLSPESEPVLRSLALFRDKSLVARAEAFATFIKVYRPEHFNSPTARLITESIHNMKAWLLDYEQSDLD